LKENTKQRSELIDKVIELKCIPELICDEYGNYVIQQILIITEETSESKFLTIITAIKSMTKNLLQSDLGRKVYDRLTLDYSDHFKSLKKNKSSKK